MRRLLLLLAPLAALCAASPAGAVIGGTPIDPATVPWFATVHGCGGTLVAPDRVVTAAHCIPGLGLYELAPTQVAGVTRRVTQYAFHPGWERMNGGVHGSPLEDVAIVQLDAPVVGVPAVTVGGVPGASARIVGSGLTVAPGTHGVADHLPLHEAVLRPISDAACAAALRHARGNSGERFDAARMLCAIDVDGKAPLSSGCNGDSGGPLYTGTPAAPVLLGVVSWGGARCGADRLPSVFGDVARSRGFITAAAPVWAPGALAAPAITRSGRRLTCAVPAFSARPDRVTVTWWRQQSGPMREVGHGRSYTARSGDRRVLCSVRAVNAGGYSNVYSSVLKI